MQNPIVGSLLQEFDIGKNNLASELIKKAPRPGVDLDIQKKLEELRKGNNKVDNNNNFNILIPLPLPLPPLSFNSFQTILQAPPPLLSSPPLYCHCRGKYRGPDQLLPNTCQQHILEE